MSMKAQRMSNDIVLFMLHHGNRCGAALLPGRSPCVHRKGGWVRSRTCPDGYQHVKSLTPKRIRTRDCPASSESLYRHRYFGSCCGRKVPVFGGNTMSPSQGPTVAERSSETSVPTLSHRNTECLFPAHLPKFIIQNGRAIRHYVSSAVGKGSLNKSRYVHSCCSNCEFQISCSGLQ